MTKSRVLLELAAVFFVLSPVLLAQRASLAGVVSDQNGSVIGDVKITLLNLDQGLKRETASNQSGDFAIPFLQPGRYLLTAQKDGFAVSEFRDLILHVGENRGVSVQLRVGAPPVEVRVSAETQQVETVSPALGAVVTGDVVRNAPLDGRDIRDLALLQAGVTPTDTDFSRGPGTFNIAGGRSDSVTYLLDGGFNNDLIDNHAVYVPNPDTVAEFRILTTNYPAEYGRNAGGIISIATRSGTNQFHGTAFDFLRNDAFDANSYFNIDNGLPRDVLKRNQYGGTFGGPLLIPHVLDGRNRVFFFIGYQGQRVIQDLTVHDAATFTPAELAGDFSQTVNGGPDPGVAAFLEQNPAFQPDPTKQAQAIIDPAHIDPVAQKYIAAGLIPTAPGGLLNSQQELTLNSNELTGKFDVDIDSKNKLAVTLGWDDTKQVSPFDYATVSGFPDSSTFADYVLNLAYTHIFSPNLLNEFNVTAERSNNSAENPAKKLPTPSELGVGITPDLATGPTNLSFDTGLNIGFSQAGPQNIVDNTFTYSDTLTWIRGRHSFKFGGGFSAYQNNTFFAFYNNGQFGFVGFGGIGSQNSFADFLLGIPANYFQGSAAPSNIRSKFSYGFAQDSWRVRKNLVLDLGLRYEYSSPKRDTFGRTFSVIPGLQSRRFINAPPGMVFPGDPGAPEGVNFPNRNNFAPRVGFAWDPWGDGKTSLRAAAGVFYDILKGEDNLQFNGAAPFDASANLSFNPPVGGFSSPSNFLSQPFVANAVPNPFPSGSPPSNFNFAAEGYLPIGGAGGIFIVDPHLHAPYTYQYHLALQRQLPANAILEVGYAGSSSHGLTALTDVNPFVLGTTNRVLNLTPTGSVCGVNELLLCYGVLEEFKNISNANYNSLIASLQKQISKNRVFGRSYFTLAYTYLHNIDNASGFENRNLIVPAYQPDFFRASADMDVRQHIVFSGGWELPFDDAFPHVSKRVTRGWSLFPIVSWRTGFPLDVFANLPSAFFFTSPGPSGAGDPALVRANLTGPITLQNPKTVQTFASQDSGSDTGHFWFNPASFSNAQCPGGSTTCVPGPTIFPNDQQAVNNPAVRTYGTLPRNYFRGPGQFNINLAFAKSTPITENVRLELRADIFNLENRAEFSNPDTNITSPTFGRILDTADPRIIQLSGRISF